MSEFERWGGAEGIRRFVDDLSTRLAADPELSALFEGVDEASLRQHREQYFIAVLGGPEHYTGRGLREAHRPLGLTDAHLDRFLVLLDASLAAVGVDADAAAEARALIDRLRPAIVSPNPGA